MLQFAGFYFGAGTCILTAAELYGNPLKMDAAGNRQSSINHQIGLLGLHCILAVGACILVGSLGSIALTTASVSLIQGAVFGVTVYMAAKLIAKSNENYIANPTARTHAAVAITLMSVATAYFYALPLVAAPTIAYADLILLHIYDIATNASR